MARERLLGLQEGFAGGLVTTVSEFSTGPAQVRRAENARLDQRGDIVKRNGTQRLHSAAVSTGNAVRNAVVWRTAATHEYLAVSNGVLYSGGTYALPMTWTSKGGTMSTSVTPSFAAFRDGSGEVLYVADGGPLNKWDGTTRTENLASTPNAAQLAVYNQRLFGITGSDQTLYWSALNNGDSLGVSGSSGGSAVVRTFGNQKLTALLTLKGSLALFHVSGVSRFTGLTQDDIAIQAGTVGISTDTGTIAPRSCIAVEGTGFFLSERGAFTITDAGVAPLDSSERPDPTVPILSVLSASDFASVCAVHAKASQEVWWFIPGEGVYRYAYRLGSWTGPCNGVFTDAPVTCLFEGLDADSSPIVCMGGSDSFVRHCDQAGVYRDDVLSDGTGGTAFTFVVRCRRIFTDRPESEKAYRWAYVFADLRGSATAQVAWRTQAGSDAFTLPNEGSAAVWGAASWGSFVWGGTGSKPHRIPLSGRGPYIDFTISDDGAAASAWSRVEVEAFDYGRRG